MDTAAQPSTEQNGCTCQTPDADGSSDNKQSSKKSFLGNFKTYFSDELHRGYELDADESNKTKFTERRERVYAFLLLPIEMEPFMTFGTLQCFDTFLYMFTFLPLRCAFVIAQLIIHPLRTLTHKLSPAYTIDVLKLLIVSSAFYMVSFADTSALYHTIRMQAVIKLYIFFNMLDVCDRLLSSVGQDILDALFWTATERVSRARLLLTAQHLALAICYVAAHTFIVLLQAVTFNVAFNSQNKALITIMLSNNFVEIKGSVFKRFTKNNLFQMACADVRERFHYVVLAVVVVLRNLSAYAWTVERELLEPLLEDTICVIVFEVIVDWIKHAFIAKFNELPKECYRDYLVSLAYDVKNSRERCASDQSDMVSRRMGFIPLPLACLVLLVTRDVPLFQATEFDLACVHSAAESLGDLWYYVSVITPSSVMEATEAALFVLIPLCKCAITFGIALITRTCAGMLIRYLAYRTTESYERDLAKRATNSSMEKGKQGGENDLESFVVKKGDPVAVAVAMHRRAHSDSFSLDQLIANRRRDSVIASIETDRGSNDALRRSLPAEGSHDDNVACTPTSTDSPEHADVRQRRASAFGRLASDEPRSERRVQSHSSEHNTPDNDCSVHHNRNNVDSLKRERDGASNGSLNEYSQITMSRPVSTTTLNLDMYCEQYDSPQPQVLGSDSKSDSDEHERDEPISMRARRRLFSTINELQTAAEDDRVREDGDETPTHTSTPARKVRGNTLSGERDRLVPGNGNGNETEQPVPVDGDATVIATLPTEIERFSMTRAGIV